MSEENVEIVRRSFEAWNRRDLTAWLTLYRSDAEVDYSRSRSPFKGVYHGHDEMETLWDVFWSTFEDVQIEPHSYIPAGSEVVVPNTAHFRGRDGIEVIARNGLVFRVENGQITRLRLFQERDEALEAAGLREWAMSQENVENTRRGIDAWNRGDLDEWLAGFAPEAEFHTTGRFADRGVYRGRAGLERYWAEIREDIEELSLSVSDMRAYR